MRYTDLRRGDIVHGYWGKSIVMKPKPYLTSVLRIPRRKGARPWMSEMSNRMIWYKSGRIRFLCMDNNGDEK